MLPWRSLWRLFVVFLEFHIATLIAKCETRLSIGCWHAGGVPDTARLDATQRRVDLRSRWRRCPLGGRRRRWSRAGNLPTPPAGRLIVPGLRRRVDFLPRALMRASRSQLRTSPLSSFHRAASSRRARRRHEWRRFLRGPYSVCARSRSASRRACHLALWPDKGVSPGGAITAVGLRHGSHPRQSQRTAIITRCCRRTTSRRSDDRPAAV